MGKTYTFDEIVARNKKPKYTFEEIAEKNKNLLGTQNRQTAAKEPAIQKETALPEIKAPRFAGITPSVRLPETVEDAVKIIDSGKSMAPSAVSGYKPPERVRAIDRAVDLANADRTANLISNAGKENRAVTEEYQARLMSDPAAKTVFRAANIAASPITAAGQSFADIGIAVSDLFRGGLGISDREFENKLDYLVNGSKFAPLFKADEKLMPETGVGKAAYDFGTNLGRMAPTILTNLATGKDGVGKTALGLSAKGAALRNALDEGATLDKASMYSTLSGLTEVATESLFSPVEKIVGGAISKTGLEKTLSKVFTKLSASKAGRKIISGVSFALSNLGEGAEEMISEAMDPIWKRVTYNKDAENASADDIIQAGVQGVIFSLGLSGLYGGANILAERSAAAPKDANISSTEAESAAATDAQNRLYEEIAAGRVPAESAAQTAPTAPTAEPEIEGTDDTAAAEPEIEERNETAGAASAWKITVPDDSARTRVLKDILELNEDVPSDEVEAEFERFYRIGRIGLPYARAQEIQVYKDIGGLREAYTLGQDEYAAEAAKKRERLRSGGVSFYGKSAGLVMNRYTDGLTQGQRTALSKASKALGIKTVLADSVRGGSAYGVYDNGVVRIDSSSANIYGVARHEFTHRFAETAPAGFEDYKNAVLSFMAEEDGVSESDLIAAKIAEYRRQGVDLSESKAAEEIAARFSERLFDGDDAAFEDICKKDGSLGQKILDVISDIIDKIKAVFTNKNTASYKAAQSDIENLETLRSRWEQLYNDAAKEAGGKDNVAESGASGEEMFDFIGTDKNGVEEYKTNVDVVKMSYEERTEDFEDKIRNEYVGRKVKLIKNGDIYYAEVLPSDAGKIARGENYDRYGGKKRNGTFPSKEEVAWDKARRRLGASGDFFQAISKAEYVKTSAHYTNKTGRLGHENVVGFDYFIKRVKVDGEIYDIVINVKTTSSGEHYIYTVELQQEKRVPSPRGSYYHKNGNGNESVEKRPIHNGAKNSFNDDNITQKNRNVNTLEGKKLKQLEIIQQTNPMTDDYHTGIRSVDDIKTAEEVFTDDPDDYIYPDFTVEDGQRALETGEVTVYSSKRIKNGTFVSPSEMNAKDYAGGRNATVFAKTVNIDDVAWIDGSEGMYAQVSETTGDFSLKEDMTETEQLRELLLKTRFEKRTVIRPSEIRSQVKKILRSYNIPEDVISADRAAEVLTNHINDYQYGYTAEGSTDLSVNDRALHRLVDDIIANATRVDSEMADNYGEIRDYLKTQEIKVPRSVIYDFGEAKDFMAFRRSLFGVMPHIKQTDSIGANIDLVYQELNDMAPELFPEDITSEADQLQRLAEVAMQLRPTEVPYFDEVTPELRSAIETELYGMAFREWHDKRDRYDAATERIIGRYEKRISEIEAAARNKVEEYRKKKIEETEKIREEYKQQVRQERLDRLSTEARTRLLKVARRLQKMKTTPENLALINETVGNIYTGALSKTQKVENHIAALAAAVEEYRAKHSDDIVLSDTQKAALADATKTAISDMSVEQVQNVVDAALALEHQIQTQNRLIGERKAREKAEYAEEVTAEFEHSAKVMNIKRISLFSDFRFTMPNATRFFRQISGYKDDGAIMELAKDIDKGQTEKIRIEHEVQSMFDDILKDKQSLREFTGPHAKEIDCGAYETRDGIRKLTLTPAMRVSLYLLSKDDHAMLRMSDGTLDGIQGGGLTVPDIKLLKKGRIQEAYSGGIRIRIDRDSVNEIWKGATPFEKKIAATVEEYMNVVAPKYINRTSLELLGYEKAGSGYYFPIVSDPKLLGKEVKQVNADGSLEGWGHLKDRVPNSRNTILLQDVFQVMSDHLDGTAKYAGLAVPIRNFNTVFHAKTDVDNSVELSLETSWGKAATDYVNALLSDLQGGREKSKKSAAMKALKGAASRAKSVALTLNARSTIKQVSQFAQAASVVGFKNVLQGLKNVAVNVAPLELIEEYSPLLWSRKKPWSFGELYSGKRSVDRFLPDWNSAVDAACIRRLWSVAEYYVRDNSPDLKTGSDEYYKEVAKVWEKITKESQASFEIVQLPAVMRDRDSIMQILTAFRTDPFNKYGQLADAVGELRMKAREFRAAEKNGDTDLSEKRKEYVESKKKFARVVGGISSAVTVTAVASLLASILLAKTDKYEDEKGEMTAASIAQGLLQDAGDELTGMVLFGQQIYDLALSVMNGEPFYGASNIFLDDIGEVFSSTSNLLRQTEKMFDGSGNSESLRISAQKFAKTLAEVCGVPVSNVTNMIYGAAMNTSKMFGSYEAEYSIMRFRYGLSSKKSEYYDLIYRAYKNDKSEYRALRRKMISDGFKADAIDKQILKRKQMEK